MDLVTKDFPVVDGGVTEEHPHGSFDVILSAPTLDRDGEVVDSKAFEPLPDHITFDTDHSMTCDSVVGSGVPSYADDGTLRVKGGYCSDERSQIIRQKVAEKHIRTTSVTFIAAERSKDAKGIPHVTKGELLNGTFTPVPSNRESVVLSAKSIVAHEVAAKVGARNSATDAATLQSMHDSSVALGASCSTDKSFQAAAVKAVAGSLEETRGRVQAALDEAYADENAYVWLRATLPTSCVFEVSSGGEPAETFQQDYTDDGSAISLTGERAAVDLTEVVTPDADSTSADDAAEPAAPVAADSAAKSADEGSVEHVKHVHLEDEIALRFAG